MKHPLPTAALFLGLACWFPLAGCAEDRTAKQSRLAASRFEAFQKALFSRDEAALRRLVCRDARRAVPGLCDVELGHRLPLVVTGVTRHNHEYRVHVRDPNPGAARDPAAEPFYVLAREDGEMRVDLLATVSYQSRTTHADRKQPKLVPGELDEHQIEQARALDAAARRRR